MEPTPSQPGDFAADPRPIAGVPPMAVRVLLAVVIVLGLAGRVVWPGSTVFCDDQARAVALAEDLSEGHWPSGGLVNSGKFRNLPGFVYLLAPVWGLWPSPVALVLATGAVNVAAVLLAGWLMRRWVGSAPAWWATAFLAAGPWPIHYSRWIWAQHLLFPAALLVYLFLKRWLEGKRWAPLGVALTLTLLVQIHLAGVVLGLAIFALLLLLARPRTHVLPLAIGAVVAIASVLPWLVGGHLATPKESRTGYEHFWRVFPAAIMSVTGLGWQLEFKEGYAQFARTLGPRRWVYMGIFAVTALLLAGGWVLGIRHLVRNRRRGRDGRRDALAMATLLVALIPLGFIALGIRTSPTYLPMWYPLPFLLMGVAVAWLIGRVRRWSGRWVLRAGLLVLLAGQLAFFAEQLLYIRQRGGVPGSILGRSYRGMVADVESLTSNVRAREVWMVYEGPSMIQQEAAAWVTRHARWSEGADGRVVVHLRFWGKHDANAVRQLAHDQSPPPGAFLVHPWPHRQQVGGLIPQTPPTP
ncbi:MAG: ArnT family glycosyltransferase [Phycisphaerae bacterium]